MFYHEVNILEVKVTCTRDEYKAAKLHICMAPLHVYIYERILVFVPF